jgi:putative peptidoglycan lipid II flippase
MKNGSDPSPSVARSARTVSLAVMGSRVLGLIREQVLAALFGASREFDAFITAFRIPNLLRDLFAEGALSAAFVTTFTQKLATEGERSAWRLANLVLNALLVVLSLVTLLGIVMAPWIVRLIAPGFADTPGKVELTAQLTRIMFPFILLVAVAALAMGMLNSKKHFGIPASASMMFNIFSILGGVGFIFVMAPGFLHNSGDAALAAKAMVAMSIGTLLGGAGQLLIQLPSLFGVGYRYQGILDWSDPGFRHVIRLLLPAVLGVAAVQVNVFVNNWFASFFADGAVTHLNCAFRLMQFPIGVFGVAISTVTLPAITAHAARGDTVEFRDTLSRSMRLAIFLCLPSACGLAVLAEPIISTIYQHGQFDAAATASTALCLRAYAVGLAGYAALKVIAPTFYALGDSRTPALVSAGSIVVNAGLSYLLGMAMGWQEAGVALSTSCVAMTNFLLLLVLMRRKIARVDMRRLAQSTARIALATGVMGLAAWGVHRVLDGNRYLDLAGSVAAGMVVFFGACRVLRVSELEDLVKMRRSRGRDKSNV